MKNSIIGLQLALLVVLGFAFSQAADAQRSGNKVKASSYKPAATTKLTDKGKALFAKDNCATCHSISGKGGCLAPLLDGVGARRSEKFVYTRIARSKEAENEFVKTYGNSELMPHLRIPPADATLVAKYLMTIPEPKAGYEVVGHSGTAAGGKSETKIDGNSASVKRGRALLSSKGCLSCHSMGNLGGSFAPKFDGISTRLSPDAIRKQMKNAELLTLNEDSEYAERGTVMPPLNLSDSEIDDLTNYLTTVK